MHSANSHAIKGKRKTIAPNDLLQAVEDMEFKEFLPEMKECLEGKEFTHAFNQSLSLFLQLSKKNRKRKKKLLQIVNENKLIKLHLLQKQMVIQLMLPWQLQTRPL